MTQATVTARGPLATVTAVDTVSGVSWAAVFAGAFVAAAFSLALVALGAGIGLVSVSPWSSNNPSVTTFTVLAAAWFIAVQLFAYGVGGYIAGRLRGGWRACIPMRFSFVIPRMGFELCGKLGDGVRRAA
jgi:hypothetical protein